MRQRYLLTVRDLFQKKRRAEGGLEEFPAVVLLGPRRCWKSTIAKETMSRRTDAFLLDLESPGDSARPTCRSGLLLHYALIALFLHGHDNQSDARG